MVLRSHRLNERLEILPGGAALLTEENVLVVADMHLGCEAALEYEGLSIPRVQTSKIRSYMDELIESIGPRRLVVAGDLKHNFSRNLIQEWNSISTFVSMLRDRVPMEVVKGNHDNYLGSILSGYGIPLRSELDISGVRLLHGHVGSLDARPTVLGHVHPSIRLRDGVGAGLKDQCFLYDEERMVLVLPALSIVASGVDVVRQGSADRISPLLAEMGLGSFVPIAFSRQRPLRFPKLSEMRRVEGA